MRLWTNGDLQLKTSLLCVPWLLCFFATGLDTGKCYSSCRLSVDPHFGAPLCSSATLADCSGLPGPNANDVYLFSILCCKHVHTLACQTPLDCSGVMERWWLSSGFITRAKNLVQDDLPLLVVFIASDDLHWQPLLHYPIAADARVIASSVLQIA